MVPNMSYVYLIEVVGTHFMIRYFVFQDVVDDYDKGVNQSHNGVFLSASRYKRSLHIVETSVGIPCG